MRVLLALALVAGLAATRVAAQESPGPKPLSFKGATLGMTLQDWKVLPIPDGAGPAPQRRCSDEGRAVSIPGYPLSVEEVKSGVVACTYVSRFNHDVLPHSIRLDRRFRVHHLAYVFKSGRLAEIRFRASIDAYADLLRRFSSAYGAPTHTVRGRTSSASRKAQRVRQTWATPSGVLTLVSPTSNLIDLSVRMAAGSSAGSAP
jgi:hypothetical protein